MKRTIIYILLTVLIATGALVLRVRELDRRPMHHDEANQAVRAGELLETGRYVYDPADHHGPTLYYLAVLLARLSGCESFAETDETTFRLVPVFFGVAFILFLSLVHDGLGRRAIAVAALLAAISPIVVYYNRFFIQESILAFLALAAIASGWRYMRSPSMGWALTTGALLGLMHATKETCVLSYAAMAAGLLPFWRERSRVRIRDLIACVLTAALVSVVFFSSFFTHWRGPLDSVMTYFSYYGRAQDADTGHIHPPYFYLKRLLWWKESPGPVWTEASIGAMALIGAIAAFVRARTGGRTAAFGRFLAIYTIALSVVYSVIPYKTPWCALTFWSTAILLAGYGIASLMDIWRPLWWKGVVLLALIGACVHLWKLSRFANGRFDVDPRNPCVYVHTTRDYMRMVQRIHDITALAPEKSELPIASVAPPEETWPLPWYLRGHGNVGYWPDPVSFDPSSFTNNAAPALAVVQPDWEEAVADKLTGDYQREYYGLRPDVLTSLYIRRDLWDKFIATRQ